MKRPHRNIEIFSMSALDLFASALGGFVLVAIILFPYFTQGKTFQDQASSAEAAASSASSDAASARSAQSSAQALASQASDAAAVASQAQASAESAAASEQSQLQGAQDAASSAQAAASSAQDAASDAEQAAADASSSAFVRQAALTSALSSEQDKTSSLMLEAANTFVIIMIQWVPDVDVDLSVTDPKNRTFALDTSNRDGKKYPDTKSQLSVDNRYGPGIEIWQAPKADPGIYQIVYNLYQYNMAASGSAVPVNGTVFYRNGSVDLPTHSLQGQSDKFRIKIEVTDTGLVRIAQ